jgi:hypothetical protein
VISPEDMAWQQRVDERLAHLDRSLAGIIKYLQQIGVPVTYITSTGEDQPEASGSGSGSGSTGVRSGNPNGVSGGNGNLRNQSQSQTVTPRELQGSFKGV